MLEEENNKTENNLKEENDQTDNDLENDKISQDATTEDDLKKDEKEPTPEELIIKLNTQIEELKDQRLRSIAELENYRKRSEKDQADALKYGIANFAKEVVSIRDNIERANASIVDELKQEEKIKPVIEGLDLIQQSIISVLDRFGIKKIEAMDQKFDHNLHQAMIEIERDDCEPGIVVQELIPGYTLHDRLLRPSMVGVSKKKNDNPDYKSS